MSCVCKDLAKLSSESGLLYVSFENRFLISHFSQILTELNLAFKRENDTVIITSNNLGSTLRCIIESDLGLLKAEKKSIQVLMLKEGEVLDFQTMTRMKSLQQYSDLLQSEFLLDILDEGALTTHFQPIVDLKRKAIHGYECLIRGVEADGTLVPPFKLFDAAQRSGLTFNLDRQARETALKTGAIKKIKENLFINFLPTTIYNPETCLEDTFKWAQSLEYDYSKIVFEVVETEKVEDFDHLAHILSYYRKQGVKTALDDVGSGFSNLNMLLKLKPDIIKIDREIIDNIHQDSFKQSVYGALVDIAKQNNITVLAEGVESENDYSYILKSGVDLAQGYFFGKPAVEPVRSIEF